MNCFGQDATSKFVAFYTRHPERSPPPLESKASIWAEIQMRKASMETEIQMREAQGKI